MTNELKNVPELRFSEFDGVWENSKLGTVANVYDGTHQTPKYTIEGIKFLSVENIKTMNSNKFISKEAFEKEFKIRPEFGDVLMTRIGDVGTPNVIETNEDLAYYVSLALLKPKKLNSYFLESLIRSQTVQNELWRKTLHIAFPKKINKNEIAKVEINYPEQMEQQKIGEFFSKLDRQIKLEEQKLAKLEEQKKGYMQQIFSQKLRFKDESGKIYPDWEKRKLNEIADFQNGKAHESYVSETGNYILVNSKFISTEAQVKKYVSQQLTPLNKQDIAIVMSDIPNGKALAKCFLVEENNKYSLNQRIGRLYNILGDSRFVYAILNRNKQLLKYDSGVGQTNLKKSEITEIMINWPVQDEQQKIGNLFRRFDDFIEGQSQKIKLLKDRKKGFLQKMFV